MRILRPVLMTIVLLLALARPAPAADSYDNCTGFIDTLPATITTQGVWCLRQELTTAATGGNAIDIQTNNVTIDCNGFKLGNLGAGPGTSATGINASGTLNNITVRHCTIQGFLNGINISGPNPGSGHLVEDNRLLLNRGTVVFVDGVASVVRRNLVINTGGKPGLNGSLGIEGSADIIDNVVDGISPGSGVTNFGPTGILVFGVAQLIRGNRVRNLAPLGGGLAVGIQAEGLGAGASIRDNVVVQGASTNGIGIKCDVRADLHDNIVGNYTASTFGGNCHDDGGNTFY